VSSSAGLGESLTALVRTARENPLATVALVALAVIAALLLAAIWITTAMVTGMGRTITRAVRALTEATGALRQGKLDHRIRIEGNDELWSVAASFNEMAAGLEKMRGMELERERLEEELRLARDIQTRLLPTGAPSVVGFDLAGVSLPARHVGGDYFDYILLDDGRIGLIVADVSGKGVPAALLMSGVRASLRSADMGRLGPSGALEHLNRFVSASVDPGKFVTAFLGILDPARGTVRYSNAGHEPPLLLRADGSSEEFSAGGLILGILREATYEEGEAEMDPGSSLVIFTDGVTEAQNPAGEFFGGGRLMQALGPLRSERAASVVEGIVGSVREFAAGAAQYDDITLIVARRG
jgi:sigma-B regulation protein RsbU (phosphoserine phosphatase)